MHKYTAFILSPETRQELLSRFAPLYPHLEADHITYRYGIEGFGDLFQPKTIEITGIADDGRGMQALVARIDGKTLKPDGRPYHITWSLDPSQNIPPEFSGKPARYSAVHANDLIAHLLDNPDSPFSLTPITPPLTIRAAPVLIAPDGAGGRTIAPLPAGAISPLSSAAPRPDFS